MGFGIPTSALKANNDSMKAATQDIAASSAIGAKENDCYFSSMIAGNGGPASGAGVVSSGVQNVSAQGSLKTSALETHLAVSGNGLFVCTSSVTERNIEYTRAGHFYTDKEGNLCNIAGLFLLGWITDEAGNVPNTVNKSDISSLIPINVNRVSGLAQATENLQLGYNLPSGAPVGTVINSSTSVFDSLGAQHNLLLEWTRTAITPCTWTLSITCADGIVNQEGLGILYGNPTPVEVVFDGDGKPLTFGGGVTPPRIEILWDNTITNANPSTVNLNLGTVGALDGVACRAGDYQLTRQSQDGREFGTFRNVSIDEDGKIFAIYSNGQSVVIGRIALANFAAPDQLEAQSGNSYIETDASGTYVLSEPRIGGFGKIVSNALESSTVDLASKLTQIIELQTHYSANTKSIEAYRRNFDDLLRVF